MNCQTGIQYKQKQSTKLTMADFNRQGCKPAMSRQSNVEFAANEKGYSRHSSLERETKDLFINQLTFQSSHLQAIQL